MLFVVVSVGLAISGEISAYDALRRAYSAAKIDAERMPFSMQAQPQLRQVGGRNVYDVRVPTLSPFDRLVVRVDAASGRVLRRTNLTRSLTSELRAYAPNPKNGFASFTVETFSPDKLENARYATNGCAAASSAEMEFHVVPMAGNEDLSGLRDYIQKTMMMELTWFVVPLCGVRPTTPVGETTEPAVGTVALAARDPFSEQNFFAHAEHVSGWFADPASFAFSARNADPMTTIVNFAQATLEAIVCTSVAYTKTPAPMGADAMTVQTAARAAFEQRREQPVPTTTGFRGCQVLPAGSALDSDDFSAFENAFFMPKVAAEELSVSEGWLARFGSKDMLLFGQGETIDFAYDPTVIYHEYTHGVVSSLGVLEGALRADPYGLDAAPAAINEAVADYFAMALTGGDGCVGPIAGGLVGRPCLRDLNQMARCPDVLMGEEHEDSLPISTSLWAARQGYAAADQPVFDQAVFATLGRLGPDPSFALVSSTVLEEIGARGLDGSPAVAAFEAANVLDCERVRPLVLGIESVPQLVYGTEDLGDYALVPGFVQHQLGVTTENQLVRLTVRDAARERSSERAPRLGGGDADMRIVMSRNGPVRFDTNTLEVVGDAEELTLTTGNYAEVTLEDGAHDLHFALINRGVGGRFLTLEARLREQIVIQAPPPPEPKGGCRATPSGSGGEWLLCLYLASAVARSARRASRARSSEMPPKR